MFKTVDKNPSSQELRKRHVKTHTRERKYIWQLCDFDVIVEGHLVEDIRRHRVV